VTLSFNAQTPQNAASKRTDHASLLATIAGLQEQIDAMSGQLTEVRPPSISAAPSPRAVRARRAADGRLPPPSRRPHPLHNTIGAAMHALSRAPRPSRPRARPQN